MKGGGIMREGGKEREREKRGGRNGEKGGEGLSSISLF